MALLATVNDLDRTNGTHLSPYFTVPCQLDEQGNLPDPPPYYAVLSSKEEAQTAKEVNRDWQPRLALQDGERLRNATLTVAWQTSYDGQLDGNPNPGGGLRMFPDAAEPGGNPRQVVRVKATVGDLAPGEKRDGHMVYFKSFDVDDPSANTGPIDDEGQTQDNRGTPPEGNLNPGFAVTNAQGEATVDFTVTMNPGDNFRVAADLNNDTWLNGLKVKQNDPQALIYESDEVTPIPPGKRTDLLTVWRKLHVMVESMGAPPPGTEWQEDDQPVTNVPDPDTGAFAGAFDDAYVKPLIVLGNQAELWSYNFQGEAGYFGTYVIEHRLDGDGEPCYEAPQYWQVYLLGAYEGPLLDGDNDPDTEGARPGDTWTDEPEGSAVYQEIMRDVCAQHGITGAKQTHYRQYFAVHEIGHQFQLSHSEWIDNVMYAPSNDDTEGIPGDIPIVFRADDLNAIRSVPYP